MTQRLWRAIPAVCALGLSLLAGPERAQAMIRGCAQVCTPSTPCSRQCLADPQEWGSEIITCGDWGTCSSDCVPNWQQVSSQPAAGYIHHNGYPYCYTFTMTRVTQRDLNACNPNDLERRYCTNPQVVQIVYSDCCWWGCYPETRDESNCSVP